MTSPATAPARNDALDGIRALAVLTVFLGHFGMPGFAGSGLGVELFFVLSGFLITRVLTARSQPAQGLGRFYFHRGVRLLPLLLLASASLWLLPGSLLGTPQKLNDFVAAVSYVSNWTRAFSVGAPMYLGHTWSLSVEEQFYLLWPWLVLAWPDRWRLALTGTLFAGALGYAALAPTLGYTDERIYNGFDTRLAALLAGAALSQVRPLPRLSPYIGWGALALFASLVWFDEKSAAGAAACWFSAGLMIVVCERSPTSGFARMLAWRGMAQVGAMSYSIYLWHYPIALALRYKLRWELLPALALGGLLTLLLSLASYLGVERPARHWRDGLRAATQERLGWWCLALSLALMASGTAFFWGRDLANLVHPQALVVEAFGPQQTAAGEGFNLQPDGRSIMWFRTNHTAPEPLWLQVQGVRLPAEVHGQAIHVAIPPDLRGHPGTWPLLFVNAAGQQLAPPVEWSVTGR